MLEIHAEPFDVETTFASIARTKKKQVQKHRGPDSPLYTTLWPMIYIIKIFGLAPYEYSKDRLAPSNLSLIFSLAFLAYYSYTIYIVFIRFTGLKRDRPILGGTETAKVIFNYCVLVYDILFTIFTRSKFVRVWNALQDFDENIRLLGYPRKERITAIMAWTLFFTQTITWIAVNQVGMYAFLETWLYNVGYMSLYIGSSIAVYKFIGITFLLGQRFQQLNEIAMKNLPPRVGDTTMLKLSRKTVQSLHNELLIAGETLNSLYSFSLFFWLGNLSVHSVSNLYFVIDWMVLTSWKNIAWPLVYCLSIWLVTFVTQLLLLHIACDYTSNEANSTASILTDWNGRLVTKDPDNEIIETSLILLSRKLRFSAAGCFYVNLKFLGSVVGLLTTYLVILLQFPE